MYLLSSISLRVLSANGGMMEDMAHLRPFRDRKVLILALVALDLLK